MGFADAIVYAASSAKMQEFFTSIKFRIATSQKLRASFHERQRRATKRAGGVSTPGAPHCNAGSDTTDHRINGRSARSIRKLLQSNSESLELRGHGKELQRLSRAYARPLPQRDNQGTTNGSSSVRNSLLHGDVDDILAQLVLDSRQVQLKELVGNGRLSTLECVCPTFSPGFNCTLVLNSLQYIASGQVFRGTYRGKTVALRERVVSEATTSAVNATFQ